MVTQEVRAKEVINTLGLLKNKGLMGEDGISNIILKLSLTVISEPLSILIRSCLSKEVFFQRKFLKKQTYCPFIKTVVVIFWKATE